jgi:hypothetical protein
MVESQRSEFAVQSAEAKAVVAKAKPLGQATQPAGGNAELAAWTMAARVLLNLDETITRE